MNNEYRNGPEAASREVTTICLLVVTMSLYRVASAPELLIAIPSNLFRSRADFVYYLFSFILVIPALVLFFRHYRAGWAMLGVYAGYSFIICLRGAINHISDGYFHTGMISLNTFNVAHALVPFLFYGWLLVTLWRKSLRRTYAITNQWNAGTIAVALLAAIV